MQYKLVAPDYVVHVADNREEVDALIKRLKLGAKLAGNIRQLCGFSGLSRMRYGMSSSSRRRRARGAMPIRARQHRARSRE